MNDLTLKQAIIDNASALAETRSVYTTIDGKPVKLELQVIETNAEADEARFQGDAGD